MPSISVLLPGSTIGTNEGGMSFCNVFLIEGERRLLFDSAHVGRRQLLTHRLRDRGLSPADIDGQVLSHAHWDHVQNIDLFKHAPLYVHGREVAYAHRPHHNDFATPEWTGAILDRMQVTEIGEGHEIMAGVRVIELPGHSPGSIGLEVETNEGLCIISGDAVRAAEAALSRRATIIFWNEEQADASVARVADSGAIIYPGHDRPFRIRDGEAHYTMEYPITVSGAPGVTFEPNPPPRARWVMPGIEEQRIEAPTGHA
jgi:glyoxylase-like metal-dependent hydrolase (beta-lactamase superfamily II)